MKDLDKILLLAKQVELTDLLHDIEFNELGTKSQILGLIYSRQEELDKEIEGLEDE